MRLGKRNAATISHDAKCKREKGLLKTAVQVFSFVCLQNKQKKIAIFQLKKKLHQTNAQFLELILDWPRRGRQKHKGRVSVIEPDTMAGPRRQTNEPEAEATGRGGRAGTAGRCLDKAQKLHIPLTSCRARIRRNDDPRRTAQRYDTQHRGVKLPRRNESPGKLYRPVVLSREVNLQRIPRDISKSSQ